MISVQLLGGAIETRWMTTGIHGCCWKTFSKHFNLSRWYKASVFTQTKIKRIRNTVMKLNKQKATFFLSKFNEEICFHHFCVQLFYSRWNYSFFQPQQSIVVLVFRIHLLYGETNRLFSYVNRETVGFNLHTKPSWVTWMTSLYRKEENFVFRKTVVEARSFVVSWVHFALCISLG